MDSGQRIILGFVIFLFGFCLLLIPYSIEKTGEWRTACREAGGIPYTPRDSRMCLSPTAIVELK
jgi:TRAP-type mannitol/chloroaromatic compound transport system permease small subunit